MGRAVRAAATVAAPEAAAARRITAGMSAKDTNDELQRRRAARAAGDRSMVTGIPAHVPTQQARPAPTDPAPTSSGAGPSLPGITLPAPVQTGSGFLLGLTLWGWVVLPYLQGGPAQVRKVLAAKFLNKTA